MDTTFHSALSIIDNGSMNDNDKIRFKDYLNRNSDKVPSIIDANNRFKNDPNHLNNIFQQMMLQDQSKPQYQQQQPSSSSTGRNEFDDNNNQPSQPYKDQSQQPTTTTNNDSQQYQQSPQFSNPQQYADNSQKQPTTSKNQQSYGDDNRQQTSNNRNLDNNNNNNENDNNYIDDVNNYNQQHEDRGKSGEDHSNLYQTPRPQQSQQPQQQQQHQSQQQKYNNGYQQQRNNQQQYQSRPPDVRDDNHPNENNDGVNIFKYENDVNPWMTFDPFIDWNAVKHNLNLHSGWLKRRHDSTGRRVRSPFPPGDYELIDAVPESKRIRVVFSSPVNNYWDSDRRISINHSDNPDEIRRKIQSAFKFDRRHFSLYQLIEAGSHNKLHNLEYDELDENKTYELIIPWLSKLSRRKEDQIANKNEKRVGDNANSSSNKANNGNVTNKKSSGHEKRDCLIN
ncbi:hypothetical protein ACTFIU_001552 [Dictyostelium citrinum]